MQSRKDFLGEISQFLYFRNGQLDHC